MDNQVHLSQSVPMFSPLTWKLTGDVGKIGLALHHTSQTLSNIFQRATK